MDDDEARISISFFVSNNSRQAESALLLSGDPQKWKAGPGFFFLSSDCSEERRSIERIICSVTKSDALCAAAAAAAKSY